MNTNVTELGDNVVPVSEWDSLRLTNSESSATLNYRTRRHCALSVTAQFQPTLFGLL